MLQAIITVYRTRSIYCAIITGHELNACTGHYAERTYT